MSHDELSQGVGANGGFGLHENVLTIRTPTGNSPQPLPLAVAQRVVTGAGRARPM